ncbi:hypothetical protein TNCV_2890821 [Trichonephila clavipes]|nr:hypothetical protein TNCV_2890821 [Trichonephila clavipes]
MKSAAYIENLTGFMKRLHRVRSQYEQQGSWSYVQDNARPHTANIVKQLLERKRVVQMEPFLPVLNPPDFFLFPRLKLAFKVKRFDDIPDIQRNVTRFLSFIPKDFLQSDRESELSGELSLFAAVESELTKSRADEAASGKAATVESELTKSAAVESELMKSAAVESELTKSASCNEFFSEAFSKNLMRVDS